MTNDGSEVTRTALLPKRGEIMTAKHLTPREPEVVALNTVAAIEMAAIEMDSSIQCRANIDTTTVSEYSARMQENDQFPPIDVFGTEKKCWIGDGWHRVLAALQFGFVDIPAIIHQGGRDEALRHALGANALHGRRRTNADKRRAVEIALKEWPNKTTAELAELCAVSRPMVEALRPVDAESASTRERRDGREIPAHNDRPQDQPTDPRPPMEGEMPIATDPPIGLPTLGPPQIGMQFARLAIMQLEQIKDDDLERNQAFDTVRRWLDDRS